LTGWLNREHHASRGAGSECVKRKQTKKPRRYKDLKVNLSGIRFEDALRKMLKTPPPIQKLSQNTPKDDR
jgi:hypothetical protein